MITFTVDEYAHWRSPIDWKWYQNYPKELQSELSALAHSFLNIEEGEHQEDIIIHSDCDDM